MSPAQRRHNGRHRPEVSDSPTSAPVAVPASRPAVVRRQRRQVVAIAKANIDKITALIVSFNTKTLTKEAVQSLHRAYPELPLILIDNGSVDGSSAYLRKLSPDTGVFTIQNEKNIGHGPALHQGMELVDTPYVLLMDSDCVVQLPGFLEAMLMRFYKDAELYAIGWLRTVDRLSGVPLEWHVKQAPLEQFCQYVHPSCALMDLAKYRRLPPAFHHGAPMLQNMLGAEKAGYHLESFPVGQYVQHLIAGTRRRYAGHWDPGQAKPGRWKATSQHPI